MIKFPHSYLRRIILKSLTQKGSFLQGAFILTISTVFVKIAGLLFTIPIANMLGGDGMGYFYTAYDIYNVFAVLASAGLPVAVSRMISETLVNGNTDEAEKIYNISSRVFTIIGAFIAAVMFLFSSQFANIIGNPNASLSIKALAVTAFCSFIMSSLRGYFQGHSVMTYTAVSQVIESFSKLIFGFLLAYVLLKTESGLFGSYGAETGPVYGSFGAICGVSIGAVLAVVFLLFNKRKARKNYKPLGLQTRSNGKILKELFRIAVLVSLGASVMSVINLLDTGIIMNVLQDKVGFAYKEANRLFGVFGNAKKIFNFPSAFIVPFTVSILPVLTAAFTAGDKEGIKKNMTNCYKYSLLLALPAGIGISLLSKPIMNIIYFRTPEEANEGAPLLAVFGISVILYAVVSVSGSILQSFGRMTKPLISLCIGAAVKCVLTFLMVGIKDLNILGAPIATCICYFVMMISNLIFLRKELKGCGSVIVSIIKILISSIIMGATALLLYKFLLGFIGIKIAGLISIAVAAVVYLVLVLITKTVTRKEIKSLLKS